MRRHLPIAMLALLLLTGCAATPAPERHYYRLSVETPKAQTGALRAPTLLVVEQPRAAGVYGERGLVYSEDAAHISLQHYHYHFWVDTPPRLLQQELIRYLQAANPTAAIAAESGREQADYRISSNLRRFERLKTERGWKIAMELQLSVESPRTASPLLVRNYEQLLDTADSTVESTIQGFSIASSTIFRQFAGELDKALVAGAPKGSE